MAFRYKHGWIKIGGAADDHVAKAKQADSEGRHADAINHLGAAISATTDKSAAFHLTELKKEMAARAMGVPYKAKPLPKRLHAMANDGGALDMATATARRLPVVRGAADIQLSRTGPGTIMARHKATGLKIGTITPEGRGYTGTHADGKPTGASGGQQGALAGLISYHNGLARNPAESAASLAGARPAVELVGPKGYEHGWIKVGVSSSDSPEDKANKMSGNAFRRGDGSQEALQGHRAAAKAHRAAASLSSSPSVSAYHTKMASLHGRVAAGKTYSNAAEKKASALGLANDGDGSAASLANGARAALNLAGAMPMSTPAASSSDGPRVTTMGAGAGKAPAPAGSPSGLSPYAAAIYKKFLAKGMKPAVALAFAKRADAMHAKAA